MAVQPSSPRESPRGNKPEKPPSWMRVYGAATFAWRAFDFWLGVVLGFGAALIASSDAVRASGVTILLTETAVSVGLLAVVLTAVAIVAALLDGVYRSVLEDDDGSIAPALMPFSTIATVSGAAALVSLVSALAWPALGPAPQIGLLALASALTGWTVAGAVSLVNQTLWHAEQKAKLGRAIDEARSLRARRMVAPEPDHEEHPHA